MKALIVLLVAVIGITSCTKSSKTSDATAYDSTKQVEDPNYLSLYEQVDSVFNINGKVFRVNAKLYDMTQVSVNQGDTLSRPTYRCLVKIFDATQKVVLSDTLLRDSWGYKGKGKSIDSYQITSPILTFDGGEIILSFNIYNYEETDAINGRIAFNINNLESRYFWVESSIGD